MVFKCLGVINEAEYLIAARDWYLENKVGMSRGRRRTFCVWFQIWRRRWLDLPQDVLDSWGDEPMIEGIDY